MLFEPSLRAKRSNPAFLRNKEAGLLRRFAPRNDEKAAHHIGSLSHQDRGSAPPLPRHLGNASIYQNPITGGAPMLNIPQATDKSFADGGIVLNA
jgi:hypothetical protein